MFDILVRSVEVDLGLIEVPTEEEILEEYKKRKEEEIEMLEQLRSLENGNESNSKNNLEGLVPKMAKGNSWNKMFGKSSSSKNEASNKKSTKSNSESPKTATVVRNSMKADERWKSPTRGGKESKATPLATMEFLDCEINMASSSFVPFDKNQCSTEKEFIAKFTSGGHDLKIGRAIIADKRSKLKNRGFFATTARNRAEVTYLLSLQTALEKEEKKQALKKSDDAKVAQMMKENNINGEVRPDAVMIQLGPDSTNATNTTTNTNNAKNENNKKVTKTKSTKKRKSQGLCGMGHIDETTIVFKKDFTCNEKNRVRTGLANLFFPELLKMKKEIKKFYPELKRELAIKRTILGKTAASASSSSQNPPQSWSLESEATDRPAPGFCTPRGDLDLNDKPTVLQCLRIKLLIGQAEEDVIGKNGKVLHKH